MKRALPFLAVFLALAAASRADEIRLKDGMKIVGTIVGFEDNSFKVQTSFGYALVRKDKIAAIIPSEPKPEPKKETAAETKKPSVPAAAAETPSANAPAPKKEAPPLVASAGEPPASSPARAPTPKEDSPPPKSRAARAPAQPSPPTSPAAKQNAPPTAERSAPAASAPVAPAPPPPIPDEVQGNIYINHTYSFRMYKPPGWEILEGAQKALPSAIVAMGTGDETTLLVIGQERMKDSLEAHAAATERQLREIYENYRRLSEHRTRIAGLPALARRYRGTLGEHDWSGVVLSFARGNDVFTILGMTYADSDLIQIQENVIAKTIASLEFAPQ